MTHPNLLSLPDEPLSLIFCYLGARVSSGSFQKPRDAFSLAQTNTHLLRVFCTQLTRINSRIPHPAPPTLSPNHLLAVVRLARSALREIHLSTGGFRLLSSLAHFCPRLEVLSLIENQGLSHPGLAELLRLPLRSFSIDNPSSHTLRLLVPPPPELTLTEVSEQHVMDILPILSDPPRTLSLDMRIKSEAAKETLLQTLHSACRQMEGISVSLGAAEGDDNECGREFETEAASLIAAVRNNDPESKCKSMKLCHTSCFELLICAHPNADIELSKGGFVYANDGDGFHTVRIALSKEPFRFDVRMLREIYIGHNIFRPLLNEGTYEGILSTVRLKHAYVEDDRAARYLGLNAEVVSLPFACLRITNWDWLSGVREVHLVQRTNVFGGCAWRLVFHTLPLLLDSFHGDIVSKDEGVINIDTPLGTFERAALRETIAAIDRFEQRGGDAGILRAAFDEKNMSNCTSLRWALVRAFSSNNVVRQGFQSI